MRCVPDEPVDITRLLQPRIEAELAFVLNRDLDQASVSETDMFYKSCVIRHMYVTLRL